MEENQDYQQRLKVLNEIRDIAGGTALHLPQICVVGDQSSGKSSVLKLLTGVNFPVDAGTCTKAAIVVECKNTDDVYYGIQDVDSKEYEKCEYDNMAAEIIRLQRTLLKSSVSSKISDVEIKVKVTGPDCIDIIVVDLPGIINVGDGADETRRLINEHIKLEQTLILLVSEAKTDHELVTAVDLANKFDTDGHRTMHIYTKFDTFDTEEAKSRAIKWVNDGREDGLGGHAVVAAPGGNKYDSATEKELLGEVGLPDDRSGVATLKARLPAIFSKLIESNLPGLKGRIETKAQNAKLELSKIGERPLDGLLMIKMAQEYLIQKKCPIQSELTPHMQKFQVDIASCKDQITPVWTASKFPPNCFVCPFFAGEDSFRQCLIEITEWWKPILERFIGEVEKIVLAFCEYLVTSQVPVSEALVRAILVSWKSYSQDIIGKFHANCLNELGRFKDFGTINHYLTSKYEGEMIVPKELVDEFVDSLTISDISEIGIDSTQILEYAKENLKHKLEGVRASYERKFEKKTLHEQQQYRLHAAVVSAATVEEKTFTDMVFKISTDLIEQVQEWVRNKLFTNEYIRENAREDAIVSRRRVILQDTLNKMNSCLEKISRII